MMARTRSRGFFRALRFLPHRPLRRQAVREAAVAGVQVVAEAPEVARPLELRQEPLREREPRLLGAHPAEPQVAAAVVAVVDVEALVAEVVGVVAQQLRRHRLRPFRS